MQIVWNENVRYINNINISFKKNRQIIFFNKRWLAFYVHELSLFIVGAHHFISLKKIKNSLNLGS